MLFHKRAVEPCGEKRRRNPIAGGKPPHVSADFDHLARPIRHGHDPLRPLFRSPSNHEISVVERDGTDTHADVTRPDVRASTIDHLEGVETFFGMELECLHAVIVPPGSG